MGKELTEVLDYLDNEAQKIIEKTRSGNEEVKKEAYKQLDILAGVRNEILRISGVEGEMY